MSITYKKLTTTLTDIHYDCSKVGYIERIGNMYSIEVYNMPFNLPIDKKQYIKGTIKRIIRDHHKRQYKLMVMRHNLRNSKMYGKVYCEFEILD